MKALGYYSIAIIIISMVVLVDDLAQGIDVSACVWGIALYAPVLYYVIKTLQSDRR